MGFNGSSSARLSVIIAKSSYFTAPSLRLFKNLMESLISSIFWVVKVVGGFSAIKVLITWFYYSVIHLYQQVKLFLYMICLPFCLCMCLLVANGAVQNSGERNKDESVFKRRVGSGPEGGPGPEGEGGGRHVANGELHY